MNKIGLLVILILSVVCTAPVCVFAAENQWHWVKVGNNIDHGWDVSSGDAEVTINGGQLSAKLFWNGSSTDIQLALKGSIANGHVTVKETLQNSDYGGSTYTGTRTVKTWTETIAGATGVETITLSDGMGMIGLTRSIRK
jgi:hypothetical protein